MNKFLFCTLVLLMYSFAYAESPVFQVNDIAINSQVDISGYDKSSSVLDETISNGQSSTILFDIDSPTSLSSQNFNIRLTNNTVNYDIGNNCDLEVSINNQIYDLNGHGEFQFDFLNGIQTINLDGIRC